VVSKVVLNLVALVEVRLTLKVMLSEELINCQVMLVALLVVGIETFSWIVPETLV